MRKIQILVVDNNVPFLTMFQNFLLSRFDNLSITSSKSPDEAIEKIKGEYFDIAILDKRLIQDNDVNDESGIELAEEIAEIHPGIKVVMMTNWHDYKDITKKLPNIDSYGEPILCGYISKKEDSPEEWYSTLKKVIKENLFVNIDLKIKLIGFPFKDLENLLIGVKIDGQKIGQTDKGLLQCISIELNDLFRKAYYENDEITIMPKHRGQSGTRVVRVQSDQNLEEIFKFGNRKKIETEFRNYKEHVTGKISERTVVENEKFARTKSLGGIAYSLIGADTENIKEFSSYFIQNEYKEIKEFLWNLFSKNCGIWYKNILPESWEDLKEIYLGNLNDGLPGVDETILKYLPDFAGKREIVDDSLDVSFENPYFSIIHSKLKPFKIKKCTTHGDLSSKNILVDKNRGWLVDFHQTGISHSLRDFIRFETSIKFELTKSRNLSDLIELEKALLTPNNFVDEYKYKDFNNDPFLIKSYESIKYVRSIANDLTKPNDIWAYYAGLFFTTVKHLDVGEVPGLEGTENNISRAYAFFSAGLIFEKLKNQGLVESKQ